MQAKTRLFGAIDIPDDKVIVLENGMIGFPEMRHFALIFDAEKEDGGKIKWLQSMDDPETAFPVMDPTLIKKDYNPTINDEILKPLGELNDSNIFVLSTVTVPKQLGTVHTAVPHSDVFTFSESLDAFDIAVLKQGVFRVPHGCTAGRGQHAVTYRQSVVMPKGITKLKSALPDGYVPALLKCGFSVRLARKNTFAYIYSVRAV